MPSPIIDAIKLLGSQAKLAEAANLSQPAIHKAAKTGRVSTETAVAIERATGGAVPRWRLRPDLWSQPMPETDGAPAQDVGAAA